jgi:hypothetical protein
MTIIVIVIVLIIILTIVTMTIIIITIIFSSMIIMIIKFIAYHFSSSFSFLLIVDSEFRGAKCFRITWERFEAICNVRLGFE